MSNVMASLAGLNMVYEAAGMHASLLGFCLETLILGDDLLGQALRCVRGIEVTEDSVSLEVIRATCLGGPGHYLGADQTLSLMQTEYIYPALADRTSPKEWLEQDRPNLLARSIARKEEILATRSDARFSPRSIKPSGIVSKFICPFKTGQQGKAHIKTLSHSRGLRARRT
jgi:trimethylamine--corrinoid protein Co-methyltransferase